MNPRFKIKSLAMMVATIFMLFIIMGFTSHSGKDKNANKTRSSVVVGEPRLFTGRSITTEDMHNRTFGAYVDDSIYKKFLGSWRRVYKVQIAAPAGWHFSGNPYVNCVRNDRGSFEWNDFSRPDHFYITSQNARYIEAIVWIGSRSIEINLACTAVQDNKSKDDYDPNDFEDFEEDD